MKPLTKNLLITIIACPLLGLLIGAATQQSIRWTYENPPWCFHTEKMRRVEFGLRNDGVVVWREIIPPVNNPATTNSPAEDATIMIAPGYTNTWTIPPWVWTNIVVTNILLDGKTDTRLEYTP